MAIDTAAKRRSALLEGLVIPDGTISGSDKAWAVWMYSGIDYAAVAGAAARAWCVVARDTYTPGAAAAQGYTAGALKEQTYHAGAVATDDC